jgi:hypothetical protein
VLEDQPQEPTFQAALRVVVRAVGHFVWAVLVALILIICWAGLTGLLIGTGAVWAYALAAVESLLFLMALLGLRALSRNPRYW